jgi:hypothetical protein
MVELDTAFTTVVPAAAALVVAEGDPAGDWASVVAVLLGVDEPQAAAIRPTTATAATAVSDRVTLDRRAGRAGDGECVSVIIGEIPP